MKKTLQAYYARTGVALAGLTLLLSAPRRAMAGFSDESQIGPSGDADFSDGTNGDIQGSIISIANTVLNIFLLIIGILAVFYLIYSGYLYITSAGNPDKVKQARQGIINAIIGIIIVVAAYFIIRFAIGIGSGVAETDLES